MTAKNDMERVGLFSELGYVSAGDKYPSVDPTSRPFNASAYKNKQMLPGGEKLRSTGLQTGYFEPTFKRIMENEAYSDPVKNRRQERAKQSKKNLGGAFVPSSHSKSNLSCFKIRFWKEVSCSVGEGWPSLFGVSSLYLSHWKKWNWVYSIV